MNARTAVLFSAGLDSAVLAAAEAQTADLHPIYVSTGLAWEAEERAAAGRLLASPVFRGAATLVTLSLPVDDLYAPGHWAIRGEPPAFDTPDEDVYLAGRNVVLLSKSAIHCAQHGIARLALGPLAGNPFPDATPEFFAAMTRALTLGLNHRLEIATPFAAMTKSEVIRLGVDLRVPLALTLSCMNPGRGRHCGRCSKCRERRDAFVAAGVEDVTEYAVPPVR
jgi:7-cyano-7-deazaguanine synthase